MKYTAFVLLFLLSKLLLAQNNSIPERLDKIDSFISNNYLDEAKKEIEQINQLIDIEPNKKSDWKVIILLKEADILMLNHKNIEASKLVLEAIDLAATYNLPKEEFKGHLMAACIYEIIEDFELCKKYLDNAYKLHKKNKLDSIYSIYCIRSSSYYYRFNNNLDSAIYFAYEGLHYAEKYLNKKQVNDAYLLLGILLQKNDYKEAIKYFLLAAEKFMQQNNYASFAVMYNNISGTLLKHNKLEEALLYNDTTFYIYHEYKLDTFTNYYYVSFYRRSEIFAAMQKNDSALIYFKKYHNIYQKFRDKEETLQIKNITEQYQSDKKEAIISAQNQQIIFIIIFLAIILIAAVLLIIQNRKINAQNKIIKKQVDELVKTLEQKQILLSELQHRVKNNLQHVISILEIQKESINFNNIDELIRSNQNRIRSMALLHKKLNVFENANEVDLNKYIIELSELVKESYDDTKNIQININCHINKISIDKALPIGLIIVELISNSIKYAFKKQNAGIINIVLTEEKMLHYSDNGIGFDFNKSHEKGLGIEIVKGLLDQLNARVESNQNNGFELKLYFE